MMLKCIFKYTILYLSFFSSYSQFDLNNGLIAKYLFEGNAKDSSPNNINSQVFGATLVDDRFGMANSAYYFNGVSDYIELENSSLKNAEFTISMWVKPISIPEVGKASILMSIGDQYGDQILSINNSYTNGSDGFTAGSYTGIARNSFSQDLHLPSTDKWYCVTYSRSKDSLYLYVDGLLKSTAYSGGYSPFYGITEGKATIGKRAFGSGQFGNVVLDDIYLYRRKLSGSEVAQLYNLDKQRNQISNSVIDLNLTSQVTNIKISNGEIGEVRLELRNESNINQGTNIKVFINIPYFPPFVKFVSANPLKGSFDIGSGLWSVPVINAQETISLTLKYLPLEYGVWYAEAEIYSSNERDSDSTPNNNVDSEDDFTRACFTMPIKVSSSTFGRQIILDDSKITNVVWEKDGQVIVNQASNILQVTSVGSYTFSSPTFICPTQGCCPYIFEQGISPFCCEPLEYGLSRVSYNQSSSPVILSIIGNNENVQDADVSSIAPNANYSNNEFMDPYAWTQDGILNVKRNYLKFDLSSIPQGAVIDSAYLSLYFGQKLLDLNPLFSGHSGENQLEIQRVLADWSENTITWNNKPATSTSNVLSVPKFTNLKQNYLNLNVTNLVSDMVQNGNFGFMIKHQLEVPYKITVFATSESVNASLRPKLNVYYH